MFSATVPVIFLVALVVVAMVSVTVVVSSSLFSTVVVPLCSW
jgi:hypothetical protein